MVRAFRHVRSNVVAYLALIVAMGGTSYAATKLPANSVGSKQIKSGSVNSKAVKDKSLKRKDFKPGQLPTGGGGGQGATGPPGPSGPQGVAGAQGPPGPTFGVTKIFSGTNPPVSPDGSPSSVFTFTLPEAGPVYLSYATPSRLLTCSAGTGRLGVYVDGTPVPGTSVALVSTGTGEGLDLPVTIDLGAGPHTADVRHDCPSGTVSGSLTNNRDSWTVLLLGSS